jgi:WS/DGAT/MGAT family acyltransferase
VQRLSGFDAWLLYSETPDTHQHTLKIAVLSDTADHPFDIEHLRRRMQRRLHLLAPLRYTLAEVPLGLHHPMWLENSDVDFDYHLREVTAPAPGGRRELEQVISWIVSIPLDRSRPLWEMHVVTGLADGRVALVTKMHHALADGVASANLLAKAVMHYPDEALAEYSPTGPDPVPSTSEVLRWAAVQAGVPIVPMVSIGGHENQLYLTHGKWLAEVTGLRKATRMSILPISFGFPFGPSLLMGLPLNAPLPTKIVTQVLEPIHVREDFGDDADPKVVDAHVRKVMQAALDELARKRRFPVIG